MRPSDVECRPQIAPPCEMAGKGERREAVFAAIVGQIAGAELETILAQRRVEKPRRPARVAEVKLHERPMGYPAMKFREPIKGNGAARREGIRPHVHQLIRVQAELL